MNHLINEYTPGKVVAGRLAKGSDLLGGLKEVCQDQGITTGLVTGIGAVSKVNLVCYNQVERRYDSSVASDERYEIASLTGNVSLLGGEPFVHIHVVLSGPDGTTLGGHVEPGCEVFLCEFAITDLTGGPALERSFDEATGLNVWPVK